ncbi:hypothetical protein ZWY2020_049069 [Hordeum vulgare]|nr:hypothetical protein ZWY2020_049069 [Hordeum vulgare]
MTRSRRGKYYINNSLWGPKSDSIESGYRVPFGKINIFDGMVGSRAPKPDISIDIVEPARYVRPVAMPNLTHPVFIGFKQGSDEPKRSATHETTLVNTDDESSMGETDSIQSLYGGCLGDLSLAMDPKVLDRTRRQIAVYMAGATQPQQNSAGNDRAGETSKSPAAILVDLTVEITKIMATPVTAENQGTINVKLAKLRDEMAKAQRDAEAEAARIETRQAQITAETARLNTENWRLERHQRTSDVVHQRRHQGRLPPDLKPTRLFDTPRTPGAGNAPGGRVSRQTRHFSQQLIAFPVSRRLRATFPTPWTTCSPQLAI